MTGGLAPRRARLLGMSLLLAMFVAGGLSGAAFDRLLSAREPGLSVLRPKEHERPAPRRPPPPSPVDIFDEVGVSPEQRAQIDAILERRTEETEAFWDQYGDQLRAIVDATRAEIRALLTDEQLAAYDSIRFERRSGPPRRNGPPGAPRPGDRR